MPKKALILSALVILLGVIAYTQLNTSATVDNAIQPYLKGEMAKLSIPEAKEELSAHIIMQEDGSPIALKEMAGKAMLVNLWASWCAPCRAEMKELAHLQKELGDDTFEVVAISVDRGGIAQARETLQEWGVEGLALYADPTMKIAIDLSEGALPTSLVVDKKGVIRASFLGPLKWDAPEAIALFTALKNGQL